ncbi:hypothetical protein P3T36_004795 [Kitasatospora sp. MAP12-15]|uniref:peptidase n=1 Tax=unclassified Kitasatospora TaxID=2633591 RepID=UPI00247318AE|nr:peptidase [Kitasatospora sp. MAP12-44]MDH6110273.1 hypothetical protein [Kitasatospora sp. MAP12-44]
MLTLLLAALCISAASAVGATTTTGRSANADPSPDGSVGIRLLEAPLNRHDDPRALTSIVDHLAPGAVINRRLEISSTSSAPQHVEVYPSAVAIEHGSMVFAPDRTANELTDWVTLDHTSLDLPPHGTAEVRATINVRPAASSGERYAVIWAQVASRPDPSHTVTTVNRVGLRLYIDVGPGGEPPSDFQIGELTATRTKDGQPEVLAQVHNTGQRALDLGGTLSLTDGPGSTNAGPFQVTHGTTLAPGDTAPVTVLLDPRLADGPWTAHLTLVSGLVKRTATATLTFAASPGSTSQGVLPQTGWPTLGPVVAVIAAAGSLGLLLLAARRRTGRR